jgi:cytidine deaminase
MTEAERLLTESADMKEITHTFTYLAYDNEAGLPEEYRELLERARESCSSSHAPYSHYHVGAAIRMENGTVVTGSNQENMSFPAGTCAERTALFAAVSAFPAVPVRTIAITAKSDSFPVTEPVPPCGICRQALLEYELKFHRKIEIILAGETGKVVVIGSVNDLLPLAFVEKGLMKKK